MRGLCIAANRIFAMMSIYNVVYICGSRICVSTPYMTGEYGIHWMTFAPRTRVHIFMIIYVMHFVAYVMYPVNFHHFLVLELMNILEWIKEFVLI